MATTFPEKLRHEMARLRAFRLTREEIAAPTGYTPRRLQDFAYGRATPAEELQTHLLACLRNLSKTLSK